MVTVKLDVIKKTEPGRAARTPTPAFDTVVSFQVLIQT